MTDQDITQLYGAPVAQVTEVPYIGYAGTTAGTTVDGVTANYGTFLCEAEKTRVLHVGPIALAWLVVIAGACPGRLYPLNGSSATIGRNPSCEIVLTDPAASRLHAKLKAETCEGDNRKTHYRLFDMASENGTQINGELASATLLKDGDAIEIGSTRLVFKQV